MKLYIFNEIITNGYQPAILDIFSLAAILSGILVIVNKNPIVSILFLIGLFASISSYLIAIGLSFLGLSYLIVYIGAVSILFLFILMLINIRTSELQSNTGNSIYLAIFIGIALNYPIFQVLPFSIAMVNNYFNLSSILYFFSLNKESMKNVYSSFGDMSRVTGNGWENYVVENSHITSIGNILYTNYNMWLFLVSLILLLAMVGAIIIIIKPNHMDEVKDYKAIGKTLEANIFPANFWPKVFSGIIIAIFIYLIRNYIITTDIIEMKIILLEDNTFSLGIIRDLGLLIFSVPLRLLLENAGIIIGETAISYGKQPLIMEPTYRSDLEEPKSYLMMENNNNNSASSAQSDSDYDSDSDLPSGVQEAKDSMNIITGNLNTIIEGTDQDKKSLKSHFSVFFQDKSATVEERWRILAEELRKELRSAQGDYITRLERYKLNEINRMYSQDHMRQQATLSLNQEIVAKRERFLHDLAELERKSNEALTNAHAPNRQSARLRNKNN